MLPFLKPKNVASVIVSHSTKDGMKDEGVEGEHSPELMSAAEDLISAVHMKDAKAVASALQAAFSINELGEEL